MWTQQEVNIMSEVNFTICDGCGSKIYIGDTVYTIDRLIYCEDCVEESEYEEKSYRCG
jgi:hypothetical protein